MGPEWLNDILEWIRANPSAAGLTIGLVAFLEGLALVGILIPGIVILFGFGALVGLGILDLRSVWLWCSVGAILGDGVSFWLGHHFKAHLRDIWPFSRFGELFARGEAFFRRHGLKSIIIGRFVGPVRPIMPVVAGMMGMKIQRYLPANILAGILWAPAYILPGVVFGASIELAKAVAFRLALLLCVLAAALWALTWLVGTGYRHLAPRTSRMLAYGMQWSHRHPVLGRFTRALVDPRSPESGTLAVFALLLVAAAWGLVSMLISLPFSEGTPRVDAWIAASMTHLRSPWADYLMALLNGFGTIFALLPAASGVLVWLLWRRRSLAAWHWAGAISVGFLLALVLGLLLKLGRGGVPIEGEPLPLLHVSMSVVVYGFFAVLIARELPARRRMWPYLVATLLVASIGFARLYFGAHAMTDLMAGTMLGIVWVTVIGIAYRRRMRRSFWTAPLAGVFFLLVAGGTGWYAMSYAGDYVRSRAPQLELERLDGTEWWSRGWLPSRPGALRGLDDRPLNVQYVGSLGRLRRTLTDGGWEQPPKASWATALEMLQPQPTPETLPILPTAWRGRAEALVLQRDSDDGSQLVLRLWPTDQLVDGRRPLWVGLVAQYRLESVLYFFSYWDHDQPQAADQRVLARDLAGFERHRFGELLLIRPAAALGPAD